METLEPFAPDNPLDSLIQQTFSTKDRKLKPEPIYKFKYNYKPSKKQLRAVLNAVLFTNGTDQIEEVVSFQKVATDSIGVSWLGVDKSKLDVGENVMLDIDSDSTFLPSFCKFLIVTQGAAYCNRAQVLARDVSVQVGSNLVLSAINEQSRDGEKQSGGRSRRGSWSLVDEYYAVPHFQFQGKGDITFEKDIQVCDSNFDLPPVVPHLDIPKKVFSTKAISTEDFIEHMKMDNYTKTDLMSGSALDTSSANLQLQIESDSVYEKRYRKLGGQKPVENANIITVKRYEEVCPITGNTHLTLIMPLLDAQSIAEARRTAGENVKIEEYEEYEVTDFGVDTDDLGKHVRFDKYTYVQLLSDTVTLDGVDENAKTTILIETKDAQFQTGKTASDAAETAKKK